MTLAVALVRNGCRKCLALSLIHSLRCRKTTDFSHLGNWLDRESDFSRCPNLNGQIPTTFTRLIFRPMIPGSTPPGRKSGWIPGPRNQANRKFLRPKAYQRRAFVFVSRERRPRVRAHRLSKITKGGLVSVVIEPRRKAGPDRGCGSNYSGFSAIIHKQVTASTGFAQRGRTLLLMKAAPCEKVQSLQAWMTRCQ